MTNLEKRDKPDKLHYLYLRILQINNMAYDAEYWLGQAEGEARIELEKEVEFYHKRLESLFKEYESIANPRLERIKKSIERAEGDTKGLLEEFKKVYEDDLNEVKKLATRHKTKKSSKPT